MIIIFPCCLVSLFLKNLLVQASYSVDCVTFIPYVVRVCLLSVHLFLFRVENYRINRGYLLCQLGVFEMANSGLEVVSNPSGIYLSQQNPDSDVLAGLAVAVVMDGSRSFLIEVQVDNQIILLHSLILLQNSNKL